MQRAKAIATLAVVLSILGGLSVWGLAAPDQAISAAERRPRQVPWTVRLPRILQSRPIPTIFQGVRNSPIRIPAVLPRFLRRRRPSMRLILERGLWRMMPCEIC